MNDRIKYPENFKQDKRKEVHMSTHYREKVENQRQREKKTFKQPEEMMAVTL